jgi:hypothetical protein
VLFHPELIKAQDLVAWASMRQAQSDFPHLVRTLLDHTPGVTRLVMRAGEGVQLAGWDGLVACQVESPFIPFGQSAWELSTAEDTARAADENFDKRTADPLGVNPAQTSFVFATPRRWPGKEAWAAARRAKGAWKDVRVLDADDLEAALDANHAAHLFASELLGRRPAHAQSLARWWEQWSAQTERVIPPELLLAGRAVQASRFRELLAGSAMPIKVCADSEEEALAFAAAALAIPIGAATGAETATEIASALVVDSREVWERCIRSRSRVALIPTFSDADIAAAIRAGHHVMLPVSRHVALGTSQSEIDLPPISREAAAASLETAGWSRAEAEKGAAHARRSLRSFLREHAIDPRRAIPPWTRPPLSDLFAPLMLAGSWSPKVPGDCEALVELVQNDYPDIERSLQHPDHRQDPVFVETGEVWTLTSPRDAWALLGRSLTSADLKRWRALAIKVLGEPDPAAALPPAERPIPPLHGLSRRWSDRLRRGLALGAVLLGTAEQLVMSDGRPPSDHARLLVHSLLEEANTDPTGEGWIRIADVLPLLAEATPEVFLDAVTNCLDHHPEALGSLFTDREGSAWAERSPHVHLLWALEILAWSDEYLSRAAECLVRLAEIDPGGRLNNRPQESLWRIFTIGMPCTDATASRRNEVLQGLAARHPLAVSQLAIRLLPGPTDWTHKTETPRLREWADVWTRRDLPDQLEALGGVVRLCVGAAQLDPTHWPAIIESFARLPEQGQDDIIAVLERVNPSALDLKSRTAAWRSLVDLDVRLERSRLAPDSDRAATRGRLKALCAEFEPPDPAWRHAWLFDWQPWLPELDLPDIRRYEESLFRAQRAAVREVFDRDGVSGLERLAASSGHPPIVGAAVAGELGDQLSDLLANLGDEATTGGLAEGWLRQMVATKGWPWIESSVSHVSSLQVRAQVAFFLALPVGQRTSALLDTAGAEVKDQYWRLVPVRPVEDEKTDLIPFSSRLLAAGRPWSAIDFLAMYVLGGTDYPDLRVEVQRALEAPVTAQEVRESPPHTLEYKVSKLLDFLEAKGTDASILLRLEVAYSPLTRRHRAPRGVHQAIASDPKLFVELVRMTVRDKGEEPPADHDPNRQARAEGALTILMSARTVPGLKDDGTIDPDVLRGWISEAQRLLNAAGLAELGEELIGQLLAGSPTGDDGIWPAEPVRDVLGDVASENIEAGLATGRLNEGEPTWRGQYEGGSREHEMAELYRGWARQVESRWPRTARVHRGIAELLERVAGSYDQEADERQSEG